MQRFKRGKDTDLSSYDIEFKNVSFAYNKDAKVIKSVKFLRQSRVRLQLLGRLYRVPVKLPY